MNWSVILLTYVNLFSVGLLDNTRSALLPVFMSFFSLNHTQIGLLFTISSGVGLLVNLFAFWWLKKFSPIVPLRVSLLFSSLCAFFLFLSGSFASLYFFIIAFLCAGFSGPLSTISMNILVRSHSTEAKRARIYSGLHSLYGLASFLAPVLIGFYFDWKLIYVVICAIFAGALIYSFQIEQKVFSKAKVAHLKDFSGRYIWAIVVGIYISIELLLSSRLTVILQEHYQFSKLDSEHYLSYFFLLLFAGRFLFSQMTVHKNLEKKLVISIVLGLGFFLGAIFVHPFFFCLVGASLSFFYPTLMSHMSFKVGDHFEALSNFCMMGTTLSMTFFHFTLGKMFQTLGIGHSLFLFPILCVLLLFFLGRLFKQR